ncbi:MAG: biotin--[acetyl-CoA-carboxylase] ligase [Saprospiraceae bacterium]|nr:biotin--[acetyl-CoA-carboxylase] ligase [Saprospiraceae bacterium]
MRFDFPHLSFTSTDSTNLQALNYLSKTNPESGFMLIADFQTAGKGQFGRNWESETGTNLLCSFIFGPLNWSIKQLFNLHLISALAIFRLLEENQLNKLSIKWPNDIYAGNKKIAGILIQNIIKEQKLQWTVIGCGINVNQSQFSDTINASSIFLETGMKFSIDVLACRLRELLIEYFQAGHRMEDLLAKYNAALYGKNQLKSLRLKNDESIRVEIQSVNAIGNLIAKNEHGEFLELTHGETNIDW